MLFSYTQHFISSFQEPTNKGSNFIYSVDLCKKMKERLEVLSTDRLVRSHRTYLNGSLWPFQMIWGTQGRNSLSGKISGKQNHLKFKNHLQSLLFVSTCVFLQKESSIFFKFSKDSVPPKCLVKIEML